MKTVILGLSLLLCASGAQAGHPDEDPVSAFLKDLFARSSPPAIELNALQMKSGSKPATTWKCAIQWAVSDTFYYYDETPVYLFEARQGNRVENVFKFHPDERRPRRVFGQKFRERELVHEAKGYWYHSPAQQALAPDRTIEYTMRETIRITPAPDFEVIVERSLKRGDFEKISARHVSTMLPGRPEPRPLRAVGSDVDVSRASDWLVYNYLLCGSGELPEVRTQGGVTIDPKRFNSGRRRPD